ncbi:MAG: rhomboid family intramembrane serine protease [Candidatus Nanosalina sp.]
MAECSECGKQTMSFTCHYCGKKFCSEHRLPESHDCEGLDSGKKEEYMAGESAEDEETSTSHKSGETSSTQQKWFKDKDVKSEVRRSRSSTPRILTDVKNTLKNSYTLSIILVTSLFFLAHQTIPGLARLLMLYPAATQQAAAAAGYSQTLLTHPWGLLTVMLVHGGLFHLLANMVTFYFFGTTLEKNIGSRKLLKFYLGTGVLASIGYVLFSNLLYLIYGAQLPGGVATLTPAVGASGAVVAAVGTIAILYPDAEVLLYFIIPMKIRTAVGVFGFIEILNITAKLAGITLPVLGGLASSAHLTGLIAGIWFGKKIRDKHGRKTRLNLFS